MLFISCHDWTFCTFSMVCDLVCLELQKEADLKSWQTLWWSLTCVLMKGYLTSQIMFHVFGVCLYYSKINVLVSGVNCCINSEMCPFTKRTANNLGKTTARLIEFKYDVSGSANKDSYIKLQGYALEITEAFSCHVYSCMVLLHFPVKSVHFGCLLNFYHTFQKHVHSCNN